MTSAAELPVNTGTTLTLQGNTKSTKMPDPLETATGVYVTVHGHFYQPPREIHTWTRLNANQAQHLSMTGMSEFTTNAIARMPLPEC